MPSSCPSQPPCPRVADVELLTVPTDFSPSDYGFRWEPEPILPGDLPATILRLRQAVTARYPDEGRVRLGIRFILRRNVQECMPGFDVFDAFKDHWPLETCLDSGRGILT